MRSATNSGSPGNPRRLRPSGIQAVREWVADNATYKGGRIYVCRDRAKPALGDDYRKMLKAAGLEVILKADGRKSYRTGRGGRCMAHRDVGGWYLPLVAQRKADAVGVALAHRKDAEPLRRNGQLPAEGLSSLSSGSATVWTRVRRDRVVALARSGDLRFLRWLRDGYHDEPTNELLIGQHYRTTARSPRLFDRDGVQAVKGDHRTEILAGTGFVDLDIQNAHPSILRTVAELHGLVVPELVQLAWHRDAVAEALVEATGFDPVGVKHALLAVLNLNGTRLSDWPSFGSVTGFALGAEKRQDVSREDMPRALDLARGFVSHPIVIALDAEIRRVVPLLGRFRERFPFTGPAKVHVLCQSLERKCLDAAVAAVGPANVRALIHDGLITATEPNVDSLSRSVSRAVFDRDEAVSFILKQKFE